jgi:hypothetical protein
MTRHENFFISPTDRRVGERNLKQRIVGVEVEVEEEEEERF